MKGINVIPQPLSSIKNLSILNEAGADTSMSSKYRFTPTRVILDDLEKEGWTVGMIKERVSRKYPSKQQFAKHLVYLTEPNFSKEVDGVSPHLILENSHNGSSKFSLHVGLLVFLCQNGLVISKGTLPGEINLRHMGYSIDHLRTTISHFVKSIPSVLDVVDKMKSKTLTSLQQSEMAIESLSYLNNKHLQPSQLLAPRRSESNIPSVWHTYNNIQENIFQGGLLYQVPSTKKPRMSRTRGVSNVDSIVGLNQKLFDTAKAFI